MAGITEVSLPGGGSMRLMRVMMTNVCRFSCSYCAIRAGRRMPRASFQPEELANAFISAYQRGFCEGLFVTSAIPGPAPRQMDKMIALMEILRERYGYGGYIHVKILPGSEPAQIERAAQLANRLSINMEAPSDDGLASIAAEKKLTADILPRLTLAGKLSLKAKQDPGARLMAKAGVTSQFVVGASRDSDRDVLGMVGSLYKQKLLHHAHYAAFQPVVDTPFADRPAVPLLREFRLYQADYLFRLYGFRPDELVFDAVGNVPLEYDPKVAWALAHPENFPVEVTRAPIGVLMRVPGVGKIAAERIVTWRRSVHFRDETDLQKAGAVMKRARGFLTLNGRRFSDHLWAEQKNLWDFKAPAVDHALRTDDPPCAYR
jgi:predicted DNA-binding helix-hairpin-helix protein